MPLALSNRQERIERTLFEVIRLLLVDTGYLPDVTTFAHSAAGSDAYQAARKAIHDSSKGFCVDLFGVGSQQSKYLKRVPRIVLVKRRFNPSFEIGLPVNPYFTAVTDIDNITHYTQQRVTNSVIEGFYDIILSANSAASDRIMNVIMANAIPGKGYLQYQDDADERFMIEYQNQSEQHDEEEGVHNYIISYRIPDLFFATPIDMANVAPIECITLNSLTTGNSLLSQTIIGNCPVFAQSLYTDGVNDVAHNPTANTEAFNPFQTAAWSASVWVKPTFAGASMNAFGVKGGGDNYNRFWLRLGSNGSMIIGSHGTIIYGPLIPGGGSHWTSWNMYSVSVEVTGTFTQTTKMYFNGVLIDTEVGSRYNYNFPTTQLGIGAQAAGNGGIIGYSTQFVFTENLVPESEWLALYNGGIGDNPENVITNPHSIYKIVEAAGTVTGSIADSLGVQDLTMSGFVLPFGVNEESP